MDLTIHPDILSLDTVGFINTHKPVVDVKTICTFCGKSCATTAIYDPNVFPNNGPTDIWYVCGPCKLFINMTSSGESVESAKQAVAREYGDKEAEEFFGTRIVRK